MLIPKKLYIRLCTVFGLFKEKQDKRVNPSARPLTTQSISIPHSISFISSPPSISINLLICLSHLCLPIYISIKSPASSPPTPPLGGGHQSIYPSPPKYLFLPIYPSIFLSAYHIFHLHLNLIIILSSRQIILRKCTIYIF